MALTANDLQDIDALLDAVDVDAAVLGQLRRRFPALSLTRCDASDLGVETPFREYRRFALHLVDGNDHCWRLTDDPARATGLVVVPLKVRA